MRELGGREGWGVEFVSTMRGALFVNVVSDIVVAWGSSPATLEAAKAPVMAASQTTGKPP